MIQFTRTIAQDQKPVPRQPAQKKKAGLRCGHCAEFRSVQPYVQEGFNGKKAIHRICPITGQPVTVDSERCDRFDLFSFIWCPKNEQWAHIRVCSHRHRTAVSEGVRDERCLVSCKIGDEVVEIVQRQQSGGFVRRK